MTHECVVCKAEPHFMVVADNEHIPTCGRHLPRVWLRVLDEGKADPASAPNFYPYRNEKLFHP